MKKLLKSLITLTLIMVLVFAAGSFFSCKKEPAKKPLPTKPNDSILQEKEYDLHNWYVSLERGVPKIKCTSENYASTTFPVPMRENFTFNGWYLDEEKVADENGKSLMTEELFKSETKDINAKWTAKETFTYKILLVYVTRIDAVLPVRDMTSTEKIHVDYTMSDLEREFCETTTIRLKETMDEMLDGLVDFQIDGYFTEEITTTEHISQGRVTTGICNHLFPNKMPEIKEKLVDYDSVLTVFSMDDYLYKLHDGSGISGSKYGGVNLDSLLAGLCAYEKDKEKIMNELIDTVELFKTNSNKENNRWIILNSWLSTLIHELAHTIEQRIDSYTFHDAGIAYAFNSTISELEAKKYYYLNAVLDGQKNVGIPYNFWKGDIANVFYQVTNDEHYGSLGYVTSNRIGEAIPLGSGNMLYEIVFGEEITVTAEPFNRSKFVRWSDGVETATRTDVITGDLTVTAIFEKI